MTIWNLRTPRACEGKSRVFVPVFVSPIRAGFPSPADDYLDQPLDFNELLIAHPAATFAVRIAGDSMEGIGLFAGDIAVVDRSVTATNGKIILGILGGQFTIKRYRVRGGQAWLEAANPAYENIKITEEMAFEVWGVVRHTIRVL
jgi:DNA polymerase V